MKHNFHSGLPIVSAVIVYISPLLPALSQDLNAFAHPTETHDLMPGHRPRLAADSKGILHVTFEGTGRNETSQDVFYTHSSDGGLSWSSPKDVSHSPASASHPDITVGTTGAINLVWSDTRSGEKNPDIFWAQSKDGGETWCEPVDISNTPGQSSEPALAVGSHDSIDVVWADTSKGERNKDIFYTSSTDGGKTWAKDPLLPAQDISNTAGTSSQPAISSDEDGIAHVVWLDGTPGEEHPDIFYIRRENGAWTKPINVSHSPRLSDHPGIACGLKGKVFTTWLDYSQKPTAPDIWCAVCGKNGRFEKPLNISNTPGVSGEPVVVSDDSGRVAFVWTDTSKTFLKPDIFARISNDSTNDFTTVMDLSNTPGISKHPDVAIKGDKMFVVWEELQGNNSILKEASLTLTNLATGPALEVNPTIHGKSGNAR